MQWEFTHIILKAELTLGCAVEEFGDASSITLTGLSAASVAVIFWLNDVAPLSFSLHLLVRILFFFVSVTICTAHKSGSGSITAQDIYMYNATKQL